VLPGALNFHYAKCLMQLDLSNFRHGAGVSWNTSDLLPSFTASTNNYTAWWQRQWSVNKLPKHLFTCTSINTNLNPIDLWRSPLAVAFLLQEWKDALGAAEGGGGGVTLKWGRLRVNHNNNNKLHNLIINSPDGVLNFNCNSSKYCLLLSHFNKAITKSLVIKSMLGNSQSSLQKKTKYNNN